MCSVYQIHIETRNLEPKKKEVGPTSARIPKNQAHSLSACIWPDSRCMIEVFRSLEI